MTGDGKRRLRLGMVDTVQDRVQSVQHMVRDVYSGAPIVRVVQNLVHLGAGVRVAHPQAQIGGGIQPHIRVFPCHPVDGNRGRWDGSPGSRLPPRSGTTGHSCRRCRRGRGRRLWRRAMADPWPAAEQGQRSPVILDLDPVGKDGGLCPICAPGEFHQSLLPPCSLGWSSSRKQRAVPPSGTVNAGGIRAVQRSMTCGQRPLNGHPFSDRRGMSVVTRPRLSARRARWRAGSSSGTASSKACV